MTLTCDDYLASTNTCIPHLALLLIEIRAYCSLRKCYLFYLLHMQACRSTNPGRSIGGFDEEVSCTWTAGSSLFAQRCTLHLLLTDSNNIVGAGYTD
jgi:hypothetical protein